MLVQLMQLVQRIVGRQRLLGEYVERGPTDAARAQRLSQRGLIDQLAARRVDEQRGRLHQADLARADDALRLLVERQMDADDVRATEQLVPANKFDAVLCFKQPEAR